MFTIDAHVHTAASGHHTTDRVIDVAKKAFERGLSAVGICEHASGMLNGCTESGFRSLLLSPRTRAGVKILIGAEANVLKNGETDISPELYKKLDYVIASLHKECYKNAGITENTKTLIRLMERGGCDILGHPADLAYPLDLRAVVRTAKETGVLLEINEASIREGGYRGDNRALTAELLLWCKRYNAPVSVGSDSHGREFVGVTPTAEAFFSVMDFPKRLIANRSVDEFLGSLKRNK